MHRTVRVNLCQRSYEVLIGQGLLADELAKALPPMRASSVVVISDSNVAPLYGQAAVKVLAGAGLAVNLIEFPAGESNKTLATCGAIFDKLFALTPAIDRHSVIVALGGGVTGDIAGFVAATALRGIRFLQCPTTLLADVDASVGGKTGVDHASGKNLIGAFHQPSGVLIDVDTLKTLPVAQIRNGLAECVKHGVIRDVTLLDFLESNAEKILACDSQTMIDLLECNVAIKAQVVSADEKEAGVRMHLNFGHTIGHAIETLVGYDQIGHGEAVSLGMVAACHIAVARKLIDKKFARRIEALLVRLSLPTTCKKLDCDKIFELMKHDKKARGGKILMVLPTGIDKVEVFSDVSVEEIQAAVKYLHH